MVSFISKVADSISGQSDFITNKFVTGFGITAISVEGGTFVAEQTQAIQSQAWVDFSHYVSVVSLVGAIGLICQIVVTIYYKIQDNKRAKAAEKRAQEAHNRDMNKPAERIGE